MDEYVRFLQRGHSIVFQELIDGDKLKLPKSWAKMISKVKSITVPPEQRILDFMATILSDMIKALKVAKSKEKPAPTLEDYTVNWFKNKYGEGMPARRQFKGFVSGLTHMIDNEAGIYHDYALLFAQLAGMHTPTSERVKAFPPASAERLILRLDGVQELSKDMRKRAKSAKHMKKQRNSIHSVSAAVTGGGTNARAMSLVSGLIEWRSAEKYLLEVMTSELGIKPDSPLLKVSMMSLWALSMDADAIGGNKETFRVVQCM